MIKIKVLLPLVAIIISGCGQISSSNDSIMSYTVTWKNYDGSVLEIDTDVEIGTMPSYDGATPTRQTDAQYNFSFSGWSPSLSAVSSNATYIAQYTSSIQVYTVTWEDDDGTVLETDRNVLYGTMPSYDGAQPSKANTVRIRYFFDGWTPAISTVVYDAVYTATYREETITYAISWYDGDNSLLTTEDYEYGEMPSYKGVEPTKETTSRYTYTFSGWSPEIVPVTRSTRYYAEFDSTNRSYTLTLDCDLNKGTVTGGGVYEYDEYVTIKAEPKEGYKFAGWYSEGEIVATQFFPEYMFYMHDHDYALNATFELKDYTITYVLGGGTNNQANPSKYTIESDTIFLQDLTRTNYIFDGWYDENNNVVTNIVKGSTGNIRLTAHWVGVQHNVYVSCDEIKGSVSGAGSYAYGSSVTVVAMPKANHSFSYWTNSAGTSYVWFEPNFTFDMPAYDVTYVAVFNDIVVKGDIIPFGSYPQTRVTNSTITNQLRTLAGVLPSASNSGAWTSYNYYISNQIEHFMWYQDVQYGGAKYRGVYFDQYRPFTTDEVSSAENSMQGVYGYSINNVYWFKFDPIQWKILSVDETRYILFSDIALDAQQYYRSLDNRTVGERTIYPSNYEYSDLRQFLTNDLYNLAFTEADKEKIQTTYNLNGLSSTGGLASNPYVEEGDYTVDKIFIPSRTFTLNSNYFPSNLDKVLGATDYAKCQGWYGVSPYYLDGYWWTRTPSPQGPTHSFFIPEDGANVYTLPVNFTNLGVCPAISYLLEE